MKYHRVLFCRNQQAVIYIVAVNARNYIGCFCSGEYCRELASKTNRHPEDQFKSVPSDSSGECLHAVMFIWQIHRQLNAGEDTIYHHRDRCIHVWFLSMILISAVYST